MGSNFWTHTAIIKHFNLPKLTASSIRFGLLQRLTFLRIIRNKRSLALKLWACTAYNLNATHSPPPVLGGAGLDFWHLQQSSEIWKYAGQRLRCGSNPHSCA